MLNQCGEFDEVNIQLQETLELGGQNMSKPLFPVYVP
jgi:hypothetical protein